MPCNRMPWACWPCRRVCPRPRKTRPCSLRSASEPIWNKPAAACLSSRIPYGTKVTADLLARIEAAEAYVSSLGFPELRVRHHGDVARIEVPNSAFQQVMAKHSELTGGLKALGWLY